MVYGNEKRSKLLIYTGIFTALIAVGGWISIPLFAVPFTLQTLFVLLASVVMKRYAVLPALLYVILGTVGLPIFHNGTAGIGVILGPTGGFIVGFIFAALAAGLFFEKGKTVLDIAGFAVATVIVYATAVIWFMVSSGSDFIGALFVCVVPFIIGDFIKAAVAFLIQRRIRCRNNITGKSDD